MWSKGRTEKQQPLFMIQRLQSKTNNMIIKKKPNAGNNYRLDGNDKGRRRIFSIYTRKKTYSDSGINQISVEQEFEKKRNEAIRLF